MGGLESYRKFNRKKKEKLALEKRLKEEQNQIKYLKNWNVEEEWSF